MTSILAVLCNAADFTPRWRSGNWPLLDGWLHILSDLAIFGAYVAIPLVLGYFVLRRKDLPFPRLFWLACVFIFICGLVHLLEAILFWVPLHRLSALVKLATALASWATVFALIPIVPRLLALRSPLQLEQEVGHRLRELRDSEARMRAIVETAADGIMTLDDIGLVQSVNRAGGKLFGLDPQAMVGRSVGQFLTSAGGGLRENLLGSGETRVFGLGSEALGRRQDGTTFPVSISMSKVRTQLGGLLTVIIHDLSELKKTEEALRHSETRLRMMLEQVPAVLCSTDRDLRVTLLTSSASTGLSGTGLSRDRNRFAGMPLSDAAEALPFLPAPDFQRALRGESVTAEVQRDDRTLEFHIEPLRDTGDGIAGTVGVGLDVTERKRVEQAHEFYAAQLRERNEKLLQSNQELDEFAYIASHDLREPLRGINNYASFLIEDYAERLDEDGRSKLETLKQLSQRMDALIDSLLQFSRVGRVDLAVGATDLNEVVGEVLASLQISLETNGVEVRLPGPLPTVRCDRVRITEVFRNLMTNAMKYNDKPEKWIEVGVTEGTTADGVPGTLAGQVFYVRDNGIGIALQHWESVFRIFKRLHGRDKYGGGTGAGLTIVKKIIERHGGRVWLESTPGQGSTFCFTIGERSTIGAVGTGALIR